MHRCLFFLLLFCFLRDTGAPQSISFSSPKHEVRAVWLTTTNGLDWPRTTDRSEQQSSLRSIVQSLHRAHFNTIFFQVRARGDAYYSSPFEPWAENLTGTLGRDPGWDPLAFLLAEAHAAGMEVHAWFNVYKVRGPNPVPPSAPPHVTRANPRWSVDIEGEQWLDPGIPEVRQFLLAVSLDLVRRYEVDGINFDFIRYPGRSFSDADTYRKFGGSLEIGDWRRGNINAFINEFYAAAVALKPMLKVGSSPLGVYEADPRAGTMGSYNAVYQDSQGWLRQGKQDYLSPQLYWDIGTTHSDPDFARLIRSWQEHAAGRQIIAGIAAYKPEVLRQVPLQIDMTRTTGAAGQSYFRFENVRSLDMFADRYRLPALIPAMVWKDSIPPLPPLNLAVSEVATNVFQIEWTLSPAAPDGDTPTKYLVYRGSPTAPRTDDVRNLIGLVSGSEPRFVDTVKIPTGLTYYYTVTALDKGNNESRPSTVATGIVRELLALKGKLSSITTLSTSVADRSGSPSLVAYRLAHRMPVALEISRLLPGGRDSLLTLLVNDFQKEGTYVVGLREVKFLPGRYTVRLRAGSTTLEQPLDVRP